MGNIIPENYLAPPSQPWGREITNRLQELEARLDGTLADTSTSAGQITNTLNYLSSRETFTVSDNTTSGTTDITGVLVTVKSVTLNFFLPRDSVVLFSSVSRTYGRAVSTGTIATREAFTSLNNIITLDGVTTVAQGMSGAGSTINSTYVWVDDPADSTCSGIATVKAGNHSAVLTVNSIIRATAAASLRNVFSSIVTAQIVG